jgi:hypothetical protein
VAHHVRTRITEGAEQTARRALPVLLAGILLVVAGCLVRLRPLAGVGFLVYAGAVGLLAGPFVSAARTKPPMHFPTWSVAAAVAWLAGLVTVLGIGTLLAPSWMDAHVLAESLTPGLAAGFGAQVLVGALSYLVPVVAGGGPASARTANLELDRGGALRVAVTNAGVLVFLLPSPRVVRVVVALLVLGALAAFLPLMFRALWAARRAQQTPVRSVSKARRSGPAPVAADRPKGQRTGLAATGIAMVVLAVSTGVALDPSALAGVRHVSSADGVHPDRPDHPRRRHRHQHAVHPRHGAGAGGQPPGDRPGEHRQHLDARPRARLRGRQRPTRTRPERGARCGRDRPRHRGLVLGRRAPADGNDLPHSRHRADQERARHGRGHGRNTRAARDDRNGPVGQRGVQPGLRGLARSRLPDA